MNDSTKCGGKLHRRDGTCTQPAGWGTDHPGFGRCKLHGGSAPSGRTAALTEQALAALEALDIEPVTNPLEALSQLAAEARALERLLRSQVAALTSLTYETVNGAEQLRPLVSLWERWADRAAQFCAVMVKLNVDDRIVAIAVRTAQSISEREGWRLDRIFDDLDLSPEQQRRIPDIVPKWLRAEPPPGALPARYVPGRGQR